MDNSLTESESGESCTSDRGGGGGEGEGGVGEEKTFIDKLLGAMKTKFNHIDEQKTNTDETNADEPDTEGETETSTTTTAPTTPLAATTTDNHEDENEGDKPRIVLLFKKPLAETKSHKDGNAKQRMLRQSGKGVAAPDETTIVKRSTRRRSKDCTESVLQSAIARKEKSYNESSKPQRLTRQLKPTQKILDNLALAKEEKLKKGSDRHGKYLDGDDANEIDSMFNSKSSESGHKKHKHKHHHSKHSKNSKKRRVIPEGNSDKESDVEQNGTKAEEKNFRRSRRISSKEESSNDNTEKFPTETNVEIDNFVNEVEVPSMTSELIASRLCLCTNITQLYAKLEDDDVTYCMGLDNIDEKVIGCSKTINKSNALMLRPSNRIPYLLLCETHRNRLLRHNCCPTCGIFCSQGKFVECESKHQYHRDCQLTVGELQCCPHCGTSTPNYNVHLTIHTNKKPIFLPTQKSQCSAKMSFPYDLKNDEEIRCVTPPLLPIGCFEILNSPDLQDETFDMVDLYDAVKENDLEKVAIILASKSVDLGAKIQELDDGTILHFAAQNGLLATIHLLLVSGAQHDIFDKEQNTPLTLAVLASKNDCVQYLIRTGATIDLKGTDGMTALHLAAKCGNLKACHYLLNSSSDCKNFVNSVDDGGWTPLVWACENGYVDVANYLICKGADLSLRDVEHNVALHWASFSGSAQIAELLLNKGCEVNAVNAHGDTPLHIGARQDMYNCVIVLLARGADVTIINKNNETPLDCVPPDGKSYNIISLNIYLQVSCDYERSNVILSNDISNGKELNPIQCYNNIDDTPKPIDYIYTIKNCITSKDIRIDTTISSLESCSCDGRCVGDDCLCGKLSYKCWYDEEGKLIPDFNYNDIPMIFECNSKCSCNSITCNNRVVQKGLMQRFELFKTELKGWGIRTLRAVPKGSFVCEYIGEIITDSEADKRDDDSFLFSLENRVCKSINDTDSYCIDARFYGNFARFINHSCNANLTPVKVFIEHQDLSFPRIAFFANTDICASEELSFDYGEKFWMAKHKLLSCYCNSINCKYSADTVDATLQNYERRLLSNDV